MSEQTDAFRANVRRYCRVLGKTYGQLAKDAELSREWLSTMLNGKANPTLPVCERIAKALGLPLEVLVAVPAPTAKTTTSSGAGDRLQCARYNDGLSKIRQCLEVYGGMSTVSTIPGFYTPEEAAAIHKVDPSTVCRWIRKRYLPAVTLGRRKLIEQRVVHEFDPPKPGNPNFKSKEGNGLRKSKKSR